MNHVLLALILAVKRRIRLLVDRIVATESGEVRFHSDAANPSLDTTARDLHRDKLELNNARAQRRRMTEQASIDSHRHFARTRSYTITYTMSAGSSERRCEGPASALKELRALERAGANNVVARDKHGRTISIEELVRSAEEAANRD